MSKLTLAINTASSKTSIALLEDAKILAEKSWESENDEAEKLMPAIAALSKKKKKNLSEICRVIVVKGPGSFTGLRVGVTVANTIAYLNKCELFGIDTCKYLWESLSENLMSGNADKSLSSSLALLIFAGSKGVYVSLPAVAHGQNLESASKAELVNLPDLVACLKERKISKIFGDISKDQKKTLSEFEFVDTKISFGEIMEKIVAKIDAGKLGQVKIVEPIYIKKPAITESKKNIFA
jgi:tRNA threonylcarbamoyl adenosine modification protein YeaZ